MTKQSTDEQSISTSRRSVLSTVGAGVAALGVGVGSTGSVKAESGTPMPLQPSKWSLEEGREDLASISEESGTITFSYDNDTASGNKYYMTATATKTGEFDVVWNYSGNHGTYGAGAAASIAAIKPSGSQTEWNLEPTAGIHEDVEDQFEFSGRRTISVDKGDTIRVQLSGSRGYWSADYNGELSLTPKNNVSSGARSSDIISHAASSWNSSGPGTHSVSGGDNSVEFTYDTNELWWQTWEYKTTVQYDGYIEVDWEWTGNHSWWWAKAEAYLEINGHQTRIVDEDVEGPFSESARIISDIPVSKGDTVRVILKGRNWDWWNRTIEGTFKATFSDAS